MSAPIRGWDDVEAEIRRVVAETSFDPATVANAGDVLAAIRNDLAIPEVAKGYWSTLRFCSRGWEIEVFEDHVEVYRFRDGQTDIRHYLHHPGGPLSTDLKNELSTLR